MEIVSRFFILCNFIAIFYSAWPSHLARLALAISKWLCSFLIVNFFSLCMYLTIVNFSGHEIKDCCCCCCFRESEKKADMTSTQEPNIFNSALLISSLYLSGMTIQKSKYFFVSFET